MQETQANEFYDRIVQGRDYTKEISLEHGSGATLEGVQMHPVDKQSLAYVVNRLPEDMFSAVEEADSPEEAEQMLEEEGEDAALGAMNDETVAAFEDLVSESLTHPDLTNTQMDEVVESLGFEVLFELGGEIMDMSFAESGAIKDFHEPE